MVFSHKKLNELTCYSEAPEVHDIRQPHQNGQTGHCPAAEQHHISILLNGELASEVRLAQLDTTANHRLHARAALQRVMLPLQCLERRKVQSAMLLVDLGNVPNRVKSLVIATLVNKVLGRLAEVEDEEAHDEDRQSDAADGEE